MALTSEQERLLDSRRATLETRPQYYNAKTDTQTPISDAMQDFLILLDPKIRSELERRLLDQAEQGLPDQAAILARALKYEEDDATEMYRAALDKVAGVDNTRESLGSLGSGVAELATLMSEIQRTQSRGVHSADQLYHQRQIAALISRIMMSSGSQYQMDKQRNSWVEVLRFYA